ncbi:MAG: DUF2281 domain-containing protein [Candidatus Schekmanbacteria bacterium]|nr:DUF2281 domain-containing protein [Candidatus Schekmanbacteria bacterium]
MKLQQLIQELPPEMQKEVEDFAKFLLAKTTKQVRRKPSFSWAGALEDLKDQYTSVELQHKISDLMIGGK